MDLKASTSKEEKAKVKYYLYKSLTIFSRSMIIVQSNNYMIFLFTLTGVSIYFKTHLSHKIKPWHPNTQVINEDSHQLLKIKLGNVSIMGVYRSPSYTSQGISLF